MPILDEAGFQLLLTEGPDAVRPAPEEEPESAGEPAPAGKSETEPAAS